MSVWELQMNKDLEATLAHVLRMPEEWQRQAAKAMLPMLYKWETRRAMPQLSDEEFDCQWRALHEPTLVGRLYQPIQGAVIKRDFFGRQPRRGPLPSCCGSVGGRRLERNLLQTGRPAGAKFPEAAAVEVIPIAFPGFDRNSGGASTSASGANEIVRCRSQARAKLQHIC